MLQRFATMLRYPIPQVVELMYRRSMLIGRKLKALREAKNLSQGDIEERTGLLRCYTSRVENGHTVPAVETLEKYARALEVPLYKLFYDGKGKAKKLDLPAAKKDEALWGAKGKAHGERRLFAEALSRMNDRKRKLLLGMAQKMAGASSK
jgi:transcriptional regulator with XRE-family HTH domain